jgi:hypothetical protein
MDHPAFASSAAQLCSHVHEAIDLAMHIPLRNIPPILPPFAAEDTTARRIRR